MKDLISVKYSELKYPLLISIYSQKPVSHQVWVEEMEKDALPKEVICKILFFYIFIISCIVKALAFINPNNYLKNIVNQNFRLLYKDFAINYFKKVIEYESLLIIVQHLHKKSKFSEFGLCDKLNDTEELYKLIYLFVGRCFSSESIKDEKLFNILKKFSSSDKDIKNLIKSLPKNINVPIINFDAICNLLSFFNRKILSYKSSIELEEKILDSHDKIADKINEFGNKIINGLLSIWLSSKDILIDTNEILKSTNYLPSIIQKEAEETRKLIIEKSFIITKEIIDAFNTIPPEYRNKSPNKLWMLARHPEFIDPLNKMIENKIIIENPSYYSFQYKPKKGEGLNILAYCIFKYADLSKKASISGNSKDYDINDEEYKGYLTYRAYEPFSLAFELKNLEKNIRKNIIPAEFNEFVIKAGLEKCKTFTL